MPRSPQNLAGPEATQPGIQFQKLAPGEVALQGISAAGTVLGEYMMVKAGAFQEGDGVEVYAKVRLVEEKPFSVFLWTLQILDTATGEVVYDRVYRDQIFELEPATETVPEFAQFVPLPPGAYQYRLRLLQSRKEEGFEYDYYVNDEFGALGSSEDFQIF